MKLFSDHFDFIAVLVLAVALGSGYRANVSPVRRVVLPMEEIRAAAHEARLAIEEAKATAESAVICVK